MFQQSRKQGEGINLPLSALGALGMAKFGNELKKQRVCFHTESKPEQEPGGGLLYLQAWLDEGYSFPRRPQDYFPTGL